MDERDQATRLGAILQGLIVGFIAFAAFVEIVVRAGGAFVFRYQGF